MADKKRAMISQPMLGRTYEEILFVRNKIKVNLEDIGYEVADTFFTKEWIDANSKGIKNKSLWCLAKSLEMMSDCDAICFACGSERARGCKIERAVANAYGLTVIDIRGDERDG